jgi:hypothetical protein
MNGPCGITAVFAASLTNVVVYQESFDNLASNQWLSSLGWETFSNAWIGTDSPLSSCPNDRAIIGTNAIHGGGGDMFGTKLLNWSHHGDKLIFKYVGLGGSTFDSGIYVREKNGNWTAGWMCGQNDNSGWYFHDGYGTYDNVGVYTDMVYAVTYLDFKNQKIWGTLTWAGGSFTSALYNFTRSPTNEIQVALYEDYRHSPKRGVDVDDITVEEENPRYLLNVISPIGTPAPPIGVSTNPLGLVITNYSGNSVVIGGTQYICSGWTMTGNNPATGSSNRFEMTVTNHATLTWS